jgi:LPS export ABC transporter protein LptC
MNIKKTLILIGVIAFLGAFAWAVFYPKGGHLERVKEELMEQSKEPDLYFKDMTVAEVIEGVKYWEITAQNSQMNKAKNAALLSKIKGVFYDNNEPVLGITAPSAVWDMKGKSIELENSTGNSIPPSYSFKSKKMSWDLASKKIVCNEGITLVNDNMIVHSDYLEADVGLKKMVMRGKPEITLE